MDPNNEWRFGRTFEYWDTEFGENTKVTEVKVIDDLNFSLTLAQPSAVILAKLSLASFGIASPAAIKEQGDKYGTAAGKTVGTGPFMFKEWIPNDKITLVANPDWWGDGPKLDALIFRSIPDNSARLAELLAGTIQQVDLAQTDFPAARAARKVIEDAGYGPYFTHRTGHGLGTEPHEEPYIYGENPLLLEPGMVFTVEPGIYLAGKAGARVEDDVVITDTGAETLSTMPRELVVVG